MFIYGLPNLRRPRRQGLLRTVLTMTAFCFSCSILFLPYSAAQSTATGSVENANPSKCPCTGNEATSGFGLTSTYDPVASFLLTRGVGHKGYELIINIPAMRLYLYNNSTFVQSYPIAVGKTVSPSNLGTTHIVNKVVNPTYYPTDWAKKGLKPVPPGPENPVGTRWLGLGWKGYGIHGNNDPSSIGKAISGGCVRMHNKDVEALAQIIPVNTPVTFVYDLVAAGRQQDTAWPMISIYKDIYKQGPLTASQVVSALRHHGFQDNFNNEAIERIIAEGSATPVPAPVDHEVKVTGAGDIRGYRTDKEVFVSLTDIVALLNEREALRLGKSVSGWGMGIEQAWFHGQTAYGPLLAVAKAFGLRVDDEGSLQIVKAQVAGKDLPDRLFWADGQLLLPLERVANALGVSVGWDVRTKSLLVNRASYVANRIVSGRAYLPIKDVEQALDVYVAWHPLEGVAIVERPQIVFGSQHDYGIWQGKEVWSPIRLLAQAMNVAVEWDPVRQAAQVNGEDVQGIHRNGRVYVSQQTIQELFPGLAVQWNESAFTLEIAAVSVDAGMEHNEQAGSEPAGDEKSGVEQVGDEQAGD